MTGFELIREISQMPDLKKQVVVVTEEGDAYVFLVDQLIFALDRPGRAGCGSIQLRTEETLSISEGK